MSLPESLVKFTRLTYCGCLMSFLKYYLPRILSFFMPFLSVLPTQKAFLFSSQPASDGVEMHLYRLHLMLVLSHTGHIPSLLNFICKNVPIPKLFSLMHLCSLRVFTIRLLMPGSDYGRFKILLEFEVKLDPKLHRYSPLSYLQLARATPFENNSVASSLGSGDNGSATVNRGNRKRSRKERAVTLEYFAVR